MAGCQRAWSGDRTPRPARQRRADKLRALGHGVVLIGPGQRILTNAAAAGEGRHRASGDPNST